MTLESIKVGISGMLLSNSRFSSSSLLWDIGISERFCIKNAFFWGDDTNPSIFLVLPHRVSVFSSFLGRGWVRLSSLLLPFWFQRPARSAILTRTLWVGGSRSKERDRKSELVLRSTYQIF